MAGHLGQAQTWAGGGAEGQKQGQEYLVAEATDFLEMRALASVTDQQLPKLLEAKNGHKGSVLRKMWVQMAGWG